MRDALPLRGDRFESGQAYYPGPGGAVWIAYVAHNQVDVVPEQDLVDHGRGDDCICGPRVEAWFRRDGSNGWIYTHHSLDGRELAEKTP